MAFHHLYARESTLTPCPLEGLPKHRVELEPVGTQLSHVKKQKTMGAHPIYMSNARIRFWGDKHELRQVTMALSSLSRWDSNGRTWLKASKSPILGSCSGKDPICEINCY